jgi:hypothetical protein
MTATMEGKVSKSLKSFLKKKFDGESALQARVDKALAVSSKRHRHCRI